ncbi:hypothetical protein TrVE_jg13057 [Triparma verrucosa]|uniref:PX domain-containing protein n=1 Tax=Triparma verrucosa TaxID=1606542 RepID=A0A9W7CIU5_9STRA|nr:hypothetical protein TrVE_jg13057 [Triparma verrucosa]
MSTSPSTQTSATASPNPSTRVVGFSAPRSSRVRRGLRVGRSHSPRRGEGEDLEPRIPQLALSVVSSGTSSLHSESPQSAGLHRGGGGDKVEEVEEANTKAVGPNRSRISGNRNRLGSISDTEEDIEDDIGEAMPGGGESGVDGLEESIFRSLYIHSDFSAKMAAHKAVAMPKRKTGKCKHGLDFGVCTENECCEIVTAKIVQSDRRMSGKYTGRKLVEYRIAVVFVSCQASVWHRYSGFRSFYEFWVQKYPQHAERFKMFPRKHMNKWAKSVTEERMTQLNEFLQEIVNDPVLKNDDLFKSFLSVDENTRRQFYDSSATQSHKVEIRELSKEFDAKMQKVKAKRKSLMKKKGDGGGVEDKDVGIEDTISMLKEAKGEQEKESQVAKKEAK